MVLLPLHLEDEEMMMKRGMRGNTTSLVHMVDGKGSKIDAIEGQMI